MPNIDDLLELSKTISYSAAQRLINDLSNERNNFSYSKELPKEVKALADTVLEEDILRSLGKTGYSILSEEAGYIAGKNDSKYWFLVDPLDGTFNFVKDLGPCAVSIAFWEDQNPVFGVIYDIYSNNLYWGGKGIGSYCNDNKLSVSTTVNKEQASICTGFPVRFDTDNENEMHQYWNLIKSYAKVRMLGSAAISLINVAKGSADVYSEQSIMLWDVAAGIAIIEGAGGCVHTSNSSEKYSLNVFASNQHLFLNHL